jgi:hypothetical protein
MDVTVEELVEACSASPDLELDTSRTLVRTVVPFKPDPRRDFRIIHIVGLDESETLDSLQSFFRGIFGKVLRVEMRWGNRHGGERFFTGEANVELETEDMAQQAVKRGIEFNGKTLSVQLFSVFKSELRTKMKNEKGLRPERRHPKQCERNSN